MGLKTILSQPTQLNDELKRLASTPGDGTSSTRDSATRPADTVELAQHAHQTLSEFEVPSRAIAITREKGGERRFVCVELTLSRTVDATLCTGVRVLERSYHRSTAEEKAQLAVVHRVAEAEYQGPRCNFPVGYKPPRLCSRPALGKVTLAPEFNPVPKEHIPTGREFKLCESHTQLFVQSYGHQVLGLYDEKPVEIQPQP